MSMNIVIIVLIVAAAVAFVAWNRRGKGNPPMDTAGSTPYMPTATGPGTASPATATGAAGPLASYDEYRRVSPSNMLNGKLTCNRCGSNLLRTAGGMASCTTCGASLYRA